MTRSLRLPRARARSMSVGLVLAILVAASAGRAEDDALPSRARPGAATRWQEATPAERRAMRAEFRSRWEQASPRQKRRARRGLRALERALPDFSPIERLSLLRAAAELPAEERKALRRRLRGIDEMAPPERAAFQAELREMIRGQAEEIERLERNRDRWRRMTEAERDEARAQMRKLRAMSVEERRALLREMEAAKAR
ncbi:MAG: DUF3106 domain-containing protein [Myxococcota bacterium]